MFFLGALTSKINKYSYRFWESKIYETVDFFDSIFYKIKIIMKGSRIVKVIPKIDKKYNQEWVSDKLRFSFDSFYNQRIDTPKILIKNKYSNISWEISFYKFLFEYIFLFFFKKHKIINNFFVFFGDNLDKRSVLFSKIFLNNMGIFNFYTKYSLEKVSQLNNFRNNFLFLKNFNFLNKIKYIIFLNINIRLENPLLNILIIKKKKQINFFSFGFLCNASINIKILSNNIFSFLKFMEGNSLFSHKLLKSNFFSFFLSSSIFIRKNGFLFFNILKNNNNIFFINLNNLDNILFNFGFFDNFKKIENKQINKLNFNLNLFINTIKLKLNSSLDLYNSYNSYNIYVGSHFNFENKYNMILPIKILYENNKNIFLDIFGNNKIFYCFNNNFKNNLSILNFFSILNYLVFSKPIKLNKIFILELFLDNLFFSSFIYLLKINKIKFIKSLFNLSLKLNFFDSFFFYSKNIKNILNFFYFLNFFFFNKEFILFSFLNLNIKSFLNIFFR